MAAALSLKSLWRRDGEERRTAVGEDSLSRELLYLNNIIARCVT